MRNGEKSAELGSAGYFCWWLPWWPRKWFIMEQKVGAVKLWWISVGTLLFSRTSWWGDLQGQYSSWPGCSVLGFFCLKRKLPSLLGCSSNRACIALHGGVFMLGEGKYGKITWFTFKKHFHLKYFQLTLFEREVQIDQFHLDKIVTIDCTWKCSYRWPFWEN